MANRATLGFVIATVALQLGSVAPATAQSTDTINLGLRGVYFVENQGQWSDASVHYGFKTHGLDIAFRQSSFTMHLARETAEASPKRERGALPFADAAQVETTSSEHLTLTVTFPGSNGVLPEAAQPQSAKFNYYIGDDESKWASNVPSFGEVIYPNLYDGVDLHVCGSDDGILKYEFLVAPGADYSRIQISYDGIDSLCVDASGDLQISTTSGTISDAAPIVWQGADVDATIPARFQLCDAHSYRIVLEGPIDPARGLVIDPDVDWMLYLGGSDSDNATGIIVDGANNVFVSGASKSLDFEGGLNSNHGGYDAFVARLDTAGNLAWMAYLGGSGDEGTAVDGGLAMTPTGRLLLAGRTTSTDFAGRTNSNHGDYDAFLATLTASGQVLGMTYYGGSAKESCGGIALDSGGNALLAGTTASSDFEGRLNDYHGNTDAFVTKINPSGAVQWMTYLGGTGERYFGDAAFAIDVDANDNAWVAGTTDSEDFEGADNQFFSTTGGFLLQVNASGSLQWMYYLQDTTTVVDAMQLVDSDHVVITAHPDATGGCCGFAMNVDSQGVVAWRNGFDGSESENFCEGSAVDGDGNVYITGYTNSPDLEGHDNTYHGGTYDAFVGKMSPQGAVLWSTFLGGSDRYEGGSAVAFDRAGNLLVVGYARSTDFEGRLNDLHGGSDAFVARLHLVDSPQLDVTSSCPAGGPITVSWSNATGSGTAALLYARNTGSFVIPNNRPCAGTTLGLGTQQLQIVFTGNSDSNGSRTLNSNASPGACGGYLQLLDLTTCATSNVARIE